MNAPRLTVSFLRDGMPTMHNYSAWLGEHHLERTRPPSGQPADCDATGEPRTQGEAVL